MSDLYLVRGVYKDFIYRFYSESSSLLECEIEVFETIKRLDCMVKIIEVVNFSDVVRCYNLDNFMEISIFKVPTFEDITVCDEWIKKINETYGFISEV